MGTGWHVPEQGGPPGLEPGFYAEDQAALDALLADPTTEHALVAPGAPSPLVHGQRVRVATPEQAEVLRAHESRPAPASTGATYRPLKGEVYLQPAGATGPFAVNSEGIQVPAGREHRAIALDDLTSPITFTAKMTSGSLDVLMRMVCEAQLERLARIREWLGENLRSERRHRRLCQALAQFGGYEEGETFKLFLGSQELARAFVERVLPRCGVGVRNGAVWLRPPPDCRLPMPDREALRVAKIVPVEGADQLAVALLKALVELMTAIVQHDLDEIPATAAPAAGDA